MKFKIIFNKSYIFMRTQAPAFLNLHICFYIFIIIYIAYIKI